MAAIVSQAGYDFVVNLKTTYESYVVQLNAQIADLETQRDAHQATIVDIDSVLADLEVEE